MPYNHPPSELFQSSMDPVWMHDPYNASGPLHWDFQSEPSGEVIEDNIVDNFYARVSVNSSRYNNAHLFPEVGMQIPYQYIDPHYLYGGTALNDYSPHTYGGELVFNNSNQQLPPEAVRTSTNNHQDGFEPSVRGVNEQSDDGIPPVHVDNISVDSTEKVMITYKGEPKIIVSPPIHIPLVNSPEYFRIFDHACDLYKKNLEKCSKQAASSQDSTDPTRPKRPSNCFLLYACNRRQAIKNANSENVITGIVSIVMSAEWTKVKECGLSTVYDDIYNRVIEKFKKEYPAYEYRRTAKKAADREQSSGSGRIPARKGRKARKNIPYPV